MCSNCLARKKPPNKTKLIRIRHRTLVWKLSTLYTLDSIITLPYLDESARRIPT